MSVYTLTQGAEGYATPKIQVELLNNTSNSQIVANFNAGTSAAGAVTSSTSAVVDMNIALDANIT
jgi:hypothetical protein